jgi:hypothetical protein
MALSNKFARLAASPWATFDWLNAQKVTVECNVLQIELFYLVIYHVMESARTPLLREIVLVDDSNLLVDFITDTVAELLHICVCERGLVTRLHWRINQHCQTVLAKQMASGAGMLIVEPRLRCPVYLPPATTVIKLHTIDLSHSQVVDATLQPLLDQQGSLTHLRTLDLSHNPLTLLTLVPLFTRLRSQLLSLNFDSTRLSERVVCNLLEQVLDTPGLWFSAANSCATAVLLPTIEYSDDTLRVVSRHVRDRLYPAVCIVGGRECTTCLPLLVTGAGSTCAVCMHQVISVYYCSTPHCRIPLCDRCGSDHRQQCRRSSVTISVVELVATLHKAACIILETGTTQIELTDIRNGAYGVVGADDKRPSVCYKIELLAWAPHLINELLVAQQLEPGDRTFNYVTRRWPTLNNLAQTGVGTLRVGRDHCYPVRFVRMDRHIVNLQSALRRTGRQEADNIQHIGSCETDSHEFKELLRCHIDSEESLARHLTRGLASVSLAVYALLSAVSSMRLMHAHGLLNIDALRAGNILLTSQQSYPDPVVVADFGLVFGIPREPIFLRSLNSREINENIPQTLDRTLRRPLGWLLAFAAKLGHTSAWAKLQAQGHAYFELQGCLTALQTELQHFCSSELHDFPDLCRNMRNYYQARISRTAVLAPMETYTGRLYDVLYRAAHIKPATGPTLYELGDETRNTLVARMEMHMFNTV